MEDLYIYIPLAPLIGSIVAGLAGRWIGRAGAHWVTILGVAVAFALSLLALKHHEQDGKTQAQGENAQDQIDSQQKSKGHTQQRRVCQGSTEIDHPAPDDETADGTGRKRHTGSA